MAVNVKLQQNARRLWIIIPSNNKRLAWSGSRWVPIDRDGLSASKPEAAYFATAEYALAYAEDVGFDIRHS